MHHWEHFICMRFWCFSRHIFWMSLAALIFSLGFDENIIMPHIQDLYFMRHMRIIIFWNRLFAGQCTQWTAGNAQTAHQVRVIGCLFLHWQRQSQDIKAQYCLALNSGSHVKIVFNTLNRVSPFVLIFALQSYSFDNRMYGVHSLIPPQTQPRQLFSWYSYSPTAPSNI